MTTRRQFIKESGSVVLGASALGHLGTQLAHAEPTEEGGRGRPTLVAIYLRGGADSLNTLVPHGDPLYYRNRPSIAIPRPGAQGSGGALRLNDLFGLHPAMERLMPLFQRGHLVPIVNVGSPHDTRSHFDAQDFMERAAPGIRSITEGWLNRFLHMTRSPDDTPFRAISLQATLPRSLRGQHPVLAVPSIQTAHTLHTFENLYACNEGQRADQQEPADRSSAQKMWQRVADAGAATIRQTRELERITQSPDNRTTTYPDSHFGAQMRDLAKLILADRGLEVAALDYRGWDHHAYQGGASGRMATMLGDVSAGLAGFAEHLGEHMNRVLVLVMSEFGRTAKENGSNGTDHGHGGFMLAMGGMVKGKRVYGKWTGLSDSALHQRRDMPVHADFRQVFAESLYDLYGFDPFKRDFFPGYNHRAMPLDLLKRV